ncbi:MAG: LysR family transcriptional regulator [Acidimicrobiia bacterium]|nr:LysR family transcriptional regulator [Acidimicrobiia bacterium]
MLHLSTQQLDYLVAVADAPTWADAAADLGVSPSALSQGLSQLERRVGVPLFDRDGRRRVLLPSAQPVLAYARTVVAQTRELSRWATAVRAGERGRLRVGMIDLAATVHFGATLQRFVQARPEVELHLAVAPSADLSAQLLAGDLSLAVIVEPAVNTGELELIELTEDDLAVYGPTNGHDVPVGEWGPWVTFPVGSHTRTLVAERLAELGARFEVVAESHQPEVLRSMVALGMGWTVLPVLQAETAPNPLRRARPAPIMSRRLVVARRRGAVADGLTDAFLAELVASVPPRSAGAHVDSTL